MAKRSAILCSLALASFSHAMSNNMCVYSLHESIVNMQSCSIDSCKVNAGNAMYFNPQVGELISMVIALTADNVCESFCNMLISSMPLYPCCFYTVGSLRN